jgi:hypothetical protein
MFPAEGRPIPAKEESMTRVGSLTSYAVLGAALLGCGSNASTGGATGALDLVPKDNAVPGWKIDNSNSKLANGPATATTQIDTENLIDGASADFFAAPNKPVLFVWQNYLSTTISTADTTTSPPTPDQQFPKGATVTLYVIQMPSASQASGIYASLVLANLYSGKTWTDPSDPKVGDGSRVADTGDHWWINFYKGNYYVEVSLGPSYSPPPDYTPGNTANRAAAFAFAAAVAGKI